MIRVLVTLRQDQILKIEVKGHAGSDVHGKDLICAGVSTVGLGALNALDQLFTEDCELEMNENLISIGVIHNSDALQKCLNFLLLQLKMVEETYPKNIKISRKEV